MEGERLTRLSLHDVGEKGPLALAPRLPCSLPLRHRPVVPLAVLGVKDRLVNEGEEVLVAPLAVDLLEVQEDGAALAVPPHPEEASDEVAAVELAPTLLPAVAELEHEAEGGSGVLGPGGGEERIE
jgi:hypothetical protein